MIKKIAIVAGGDSSEYVVSLRSAQGIWSFLNHDKYDVSVIVMKGQDWHMVEYDGQNYHNDKTWPVNLNDFSVDKDGQRLTFDFAYIIIHGTPGENGLVQGYFDLIGLPYSCCGVLAAALTCSKYFCNKYLSTMGIPVAKSILLHKGESVSTEEAVAQLGLPMFVKPTDSGSSFGVTKVKRIEDFDKAVELAFSEGQTLLCEEAITGQELQVGVYANGKDVVALPVIEIVSENEFFDYDAKYNGKSQEICPARIPDADRDALQEAARRIYRRMDCSGCVRIDFILTPEKEVYFLEINTIPGMTGASLFPKAAKAVGIGFGELCRRIAQISLNQSRS